jgi:hypothetical protein
MRNISGSIFNILFFLILIQPAEGQDTLRTFGPRFGIDLSRFVYYFADPAEKGAEISLDIELLKNVYPVIEVGYSSMADEVVQAEYSSGGPYARLGFDYNVLPIQDRSVHHSITAGIRYANSRFSHKAEHITIPSDYWGNLVIDSYENDLSGHWIELAGGIRAELLTNFFLGWSVRYRILLNPGMDPRVTPLLIPGYGLGTQDRSFGISYSVLYKIPLIKK